MSIFSFLFGPTAPPVEGPSVAIGVPQEPTLYRFQALETFWSDEFKSQYAKSDHYNVRRNNDKLALAVERWVAQGKVRKV